MNDKTPLKTYQMLESHGCRFISLKPRSKLPVGKWTNESLSPEQAVKRLEHDADGVPRGNVGVVPGGDVFVIDLDGEDAIERYNTVCEGLPDSETFETFAVVTPNGAHVYLHAKEIDQIDVTARKTKWGDGVDIRSAKSNSYVVGAYSYVENPQPEKESGFYRTLGDELTPVGVAPPEIEDLSRKAEKAPTALPTASHSKPEQPAAYQPEAVKPSLQACRNRVTRMLNKIAESVEGGRNQTISDCASVIGGYVIHYREEFEDVEDRLLAAVRKTFTEDDTEDEKNKHIETATRRFNEGLEQPLYGDDTNSTEKNDPTKFLAIIGRMGYKARFNIPLGIGEWWIEPESLWRSFNDYEHTVLFTRIWAEQGWEIPKSKEDRLLCHVYEQNRVNPNIEFLSRYRIKHNRPEWTLENSLSWWIGDSEYERWCQKAIWLQMISRLMGDPKPIKPTVTLRGPTNVGKSSLVKNLLPEELGEVGNFTFSGGYNDVLSLLSKHYVVEFDELSGMSKKDVAFMKSILGAGSKYTRRLHTHGLMKVEYRAAIIGTVNEEPLLFDDKALMGRFAFVDMRRNDDCNPEILIPEMREHYLALAFQAYKNGERANIMPNGLVEQQMAQANLSVYRDNTFDDQYVKVVWENVPIKSLITELAGHFGLARNLKDYRAMRLQQQFTRYLINKGFVREIGGKGNATWWSRPVDSDFPLPDVDVSQSNHLERQRRAAAAYEKMNPVIIGTGFTKVKSDDLDI